MDDTTVKSILNDMYKLYKKFKAVPRKGSAGMDDYWERFQRDVMEFSRKWENDQFAIECCCAVWRYCEIIGGYVSENGDEIR